MFIALVENVGNAWDKEGMKSIQLKTDHYTQGIVSPRGTEKGGFDKKTGS